MALPLADHFLRLLTKHHYSRTYRSREKRKNRLGSPIWLLVWPQLPSQRPKINWDLISHFFLRVVAARGVRKMANYERTLNDVKNKSEVRNTQIIKPLTLFSVAIREKCFPKHFTKIKLRLIFQTPRHPWRCWVKKLFFG